MWLHSGVNRWYRCSAPCFASQQLNLVYILRYGDKCALRYSLKARDVPGHFPLGGGLTIHPTAMKKRGHEKHYDQWHAKSFVA